MIKILKKSNNQNNYLVTIAIGSKYLNKWKKYSYISWKKYCEKYNLGLIVVTKNLINKNDPNWKNANWQKLLIGSKLEDIKIKINNICYLDTDIIINNLSPNIFKFHDRNKFSVISKRFNMPFDSYSALMTKIALLRKKYLDRSYPLNSALNMSIRDLYKFHNLKNQGNEFCSGVIVFNLKKFAKKMKSWFYKYGKNIKSVTGGEQTHFNYEVLNTKKINWLNYKFQAIWLYEMAYKYPFLYKTNSSKVIKYCIESSLYENYFLHFAGKWPDSNMWNFSGKINYIFDKNYYKIFIKKKNFLKGRSKGILYPKLNK